jgi:hypothetical protein
MGKRGAGDQGVRGMIEIGPYKIEYVTYTYRDPLSGYDKERTDLFIIKPDGEGGSFDEAKFIAMLDQFWKEEF